MVQSMTYKVIGPPHRLYINTSLNLEDTLFNTNCGDITLGRNVFTGHRVMMLTGSHDYSQFDMDRAHSWTLIKDNHIVIEDGVWLASGSIIIGPCTIGKHSVVAAGAVVTPGIYPAYSLIGGNPAKVIKKIKGGEVKYEHNPHI